MDQTEAGSLSMSSHETVQWIADLIRNEYDKAPNWYRACDNWDDGAERVAAQIIERLRAAPAQPQPFGYLIKKAGVNTGYYWISPAEFEHVEERFRYLYKPIYEAAA